MKRLLLLLWIGGALAGFAQEPPAPQPLKEVEQLKGENIRLKLDSLDKQMRLMQEQYARLYEAQQQLVRQLQALDEEILRERALPSPVWRVNWQTGRIETTEPQRREDTEKNK